jgi:hypothetical protein
VVSTPILDEHGEFAGSYALTINLTEQKRISDRERYPLSLLRHDIGNKFQGVYDHLELLKNTELSGRQKQYVENLEGSLQDVMELIVEV